MSPAIKRIAICACLLVVGYALAAQPTRLKHYAVMEKVSPYATYASSKHIALIAGNYWLVWPVVYQLMYDRKPAFGITLRGDGNIDGLRHWLDGQRRGGELKAMCIGAEVPVCVENLRKLTGLAWSQSAGQCDVAECVVLTSALDRR